MKIQLNDDSNNIWLNIEKIDVDSYYLLGCNGDCIVLTRELLTGVVETLRASFEHGMDLDIKISYDNGECRFIDGMSIYSTGTAYKLVTDSVQIPLSLEWAEVMEWLIG